MRCSEPLGSPVLAWLQHEQRRSKTRSSRKTKLAQRVMLQLKLLAWAKFAQTAIPAGGRERRSLRTDSRATHAFGKNAFPSRRDQANPNRTSECGLRRELDDTAVRPMRCSGRSYPLGAARQKLCCLAISYDPPREGNLAFASMKGTL